MGSITTCGDELLLATAGERSTSKKASSPAISIRSTSRSAFLTSSASSRRSSSSLSSSPGMAPSLVLASSFSQSLATSPYESRGALVSRRFSSSSFRGCVGGGAELAAPSREALGSVQGENSNTSVTVRASGATEEAAIGRFSDVSGFYTGGDDFPRLLRTSSPRDIISSPPTTIPGPETSTSRSAARSFPKYINDRADLVSLHNPLKRLERLGCGWLAVLLEWEGVIVEDDPALERQAWAVLAEEEGKSKPPAFLLKRAEGMKNEQAIMEVLCWARDFRTVKRLAKRKDEIYGELQGGCYRVRPGSREFVESLRRYNVPLAVVSTRPRVLIERAIEAVGMEGWFDIVVSAEDVQRGKPDPEMFQYAAMQLNFIPERCIVVGNSNSTIEAGHDAYMKVIAVTGKHPAYELGAAERVVSRLDSLSVVDLKNLSDLDSPEFQPPEMQLEVEAEVERPKLEVTFADN